MVISGYTSTTKRNIMSDNSGDRITDDAYVHASASPRRLDPELINGESTTNVLKNDNSKISNRRMSNTANLGNPQVVVATDSSQSNGSNVVIDINNPDPKVVNVVARHLNKNEDNLQTQGGDMTRDLYKWTNENSSTSLSTSQRGAQGHNQILPLQPPVLSNTNNETLNKNMTSNFRRKRSMSFSALSVNSTTLNNITNPDSYGATMQNNNGGNDLPAIHMTHEEIRAPGGFRRSYIIQRRRKRNLDPKLPEFFTKNFIEFLTLYGHFAGEDLSESDDEEEDSDLEVGGEEVDYEEEEVIESENEASGLLDRTVSAGRHKHKASTVKAVLLLLKSFVGTGVLFLPKAFSNGGWGFSSLCLLFCAVISYYCFILLIKTKDKVGVDGYGEIGNVLYGDKMKLAILMSIALSQIGFSAAYTVFTATNLKVFVEGMFNINSTTLSLGFYIILQTLIFIPFSLTRSITKLSGTALVADLFILLGLGYVYYFSGHYVLKNGPASYSMVFFNKTDWSLFIGTAIFTFEGIGLLIPIQESMKHPEHFQSTLFGVMIIVTFVFVSCGLLCYSAFGSRVETVVLLNFPQDNVTGTVQLLYALAILLSTPLQLFPAIRILENWTFPSHASGKYNPKIKWLKNYFRGGIVILTSIIAWIGANDLDKFVSLVGSFACIPLIYIHPPLLHYKAFLGDKSIPAWKRLADIIIAIFGISIMAYTSWQTIIMWVK